MNLISRISLATLLLLGTAMAQEGAKTAPATAQKSSYTAIEVYPLTTCVVSGKTLEAEKKKSVEVGGRTYFTCCEKCIDKIKASPADYGAKLDAAIVSAETGNYPLKTCPISGKALGSMGDAKKLVLDGHLVQLCCDHCTEKATAKKTEIVAQIQAAAYAAQKDKYPLKKCPVSGEEIKKGEEVDVMVGTTLVRMCCSDCIDDFKKDPAKTLAKLPAAGAPKTEGKAEPTKNESGEKKEPTAAASCCGDGQTGCCSDKSEKKDGASCCGTESKDAKKDDKKPATTTAK